MDPFSLLSSGLNFNKEKNKRGLTAFGHAPAPSAPPKSKNGPVAENSDHEEEEDVNDLTRHHELPDIPHTNDPFEVRNYMY